MDLRGKRDWPYFVKRYRDLGGKIRGKRDWRFKREERFGILLRGFGKN